MNGFYRKTELATIRPPDPLVARCGSCGLLDGCSSPKMPVHGKGRRKILIVGESPGGEEDRANRPFVGKAGQHLRAALDKQGVDLDDDCWTTNANICHPPRNKTPTDKQVGYCRPNLTRAVRDLQPEGIVLLGKNAVRSLIGWLWKDDPGSMDRWAGWTIPCQRLNTWVHPVHHPSYAMRQLEARDTATQMYFEHYLREAFRVEGRPWPDGPPDYASRLRLVHDDREAADAVLLFKRAGRIAFDFETDRLKPDAEGSRIVSCSVSDGETSIAYPWLGEAVRATKELLRSPVPKIAANVKFEARWTRKHLGIEVRNWVWDTVVAAHLIDNRPEVCGLKFQAFVLLGQESYDDSVRPFLKGRDQGGNSPNRVGEIDLRSLLKYNAMDSLLEWEVARVQMERMGMPDGYVR